MNLTLPDYRNDSPRQRQHQGAEGAQGRGDDEYGQIGGMHGLLDEYLIDVHVTASLRMEISLSDARLMG